MENVNPTFTTLEIPITPGLVDHPQNSNGNQFPIKTHLLRPDYGGYSKNRCFPDRTFEFQTDILQTNKTKQTMNLNQPAIKIKQLYRSD